MSDPKGDSHEQATIDSWLLAGMPGPLRHANYLVGSLAPQYRLIVDVLLEEQSHSLTGVARTELPALLKVHAAALVGPAASGPLLEDAAFELDGRMTQLRRWGVIEVWQDRATSEADFVRNRDRYQLTPEAAELHRFVRAAESDSGGGSMTALLAPPVIAARLLDFRVAIDAGDVAEAEQAWVQIETTLRDMASAAGTWQAQMAAALAGAPSPEKVAVLRNTLLAYVEVWGAGVDVHSGQIVNLVDGVEVHNDTWRALALARVGAEAADGLVDAVADGHLATLDTLRSWFGGPDSQGRRLRRQVRDIIGDLVRGHRTLLHVGGAVTRRAELLRVAAVIESAKDEASGWDAWCRATGLFACRHLAIASEELNDIGARTSFWDAPPAPVEARIRAQGPRALVGTPARVPDLSAARNDARRRAADLRRGQLEAEAGIRRRSGRPLSGWGPLNDAELDLLLGLLSVARHEAADGSRHGISDDGRWLVRVVPNDHTSAVIGTPDGSLVCADVVVEVVPA